MSQLSAEDEAELQSLLKQLLRSINDRISGAPSTECAEEILLHLEETDKNFHNYEFVKYLRQYVESSLGTVVEEETKNLTRGDGQHAIGSGHDTLIHAVTRRTRDSAEYQQMIQTLKNTMIMVVESSINKFEEDQMRKEEMHREKQHSQSNSQYTDNCSDSDSSFNQSYAFIRQEQLQALAEKLDSSRPKEAKATTVREALAKLEEKSGEKVSETTAVKLYGQTPPIEKMDASLSTLTNCEKLSLSTNCIEKITNLNGLKNLKILSLGRNNIKFFTGLDAVKDTLEELWISYNLIETLKGIQCMKKLKVLYMSNNLVKEWGEFMRLSELPCLVDLVFVGNPLEEKYSAEGTWMDEASKRLPNLQKLDGTPIIKQEEDEGDGRS